MKLPVSSIPSSTIATRMMYASSGSAHAIFVPAPSAIASPRQTSALPAMNVAPARSNRHEGIRDNATA
jgi:hypothetical protein